MADLWPYALDALPVPGIPDETAAEAMVSELREALMAHYGYDASPRPGRMSRREAEDWREADRQATLEARRRIANRIRALRERDA